MSSRPRFFTLRRARQTTCSQSGISVFRSRFAWSLVSVWAAEQWSRSESVPGQWMILKRTVQVGLRGVAGVARFGEQTEVGQPSRATSSASRRHKSGHARARSQAASANVNRNSPPAKPRKASARWDLLTNTERPDPDRILGRGAEHRVPNGLARRFCQIHGSPPLQITSSCFPQLA